MGKIDREELEWLREFCKDGKISHLQVGDIVIQMEHDAESEVPAGFQMQPPHVSDALQDV